MPFDDDIIRKRVTLHPLKSDGTVDTEINLYPKVFVDGVVDRQGNPVDIATQSELDEAVANIEEEIQHLPKGDVTEEELQNVVSTLEGVISTKATQEDINVAVADKVTEEELNTALAGKQDTLTPGENIIIENGVISAKVPNDVYNLNFYLKNGQVVIDVEDWMSDEEEVNKNAIMNINGYPYVCWLSKSMTSKGGNLSIDLETGGYIAIECNGDPTLSENWSINLNGYFAQIYDDSDFAPYLKISNGEVIDDNVINPQWVADFSIRAGILDYTPAKAWVGIEDALEPCTIYRKFSEDKDNIIICIQTSKGEYKLTYQYEKDPLPPL